MKTLEGVQVVLSSEKSEELFHTAMCDVFGMGYHQGYGLDLEYNEDEFNQSRKKLSNPCWEDVLLQMLKDGYKLTLVDNECDGDYTRSITIDDVHNKVGNTPIHNLMNVIEGTGDVIDTDCIIQTVFFDEIIFG